jgi:DNA-binding transcriptional LysR family regulator
MRHVQTLRAVTLIARLGSIRKAAEQLHIVPSALTRQLQDLEEEIGAPLFERKARGMRLTAAGELFVRYSRSAVHDLDLVRSQIEDLKGLRGGTVGMSAIEAVATTVLPQAIADFRKRNPRVRFEVHVMGADQVVRSVEADEADIGITFNPAPSRGFRVLAEFAQELYAIMSDGHPLARRQSIRLRDCQGYPLLLGDATLGGRLLLDQFLMRSSLHLEPVLVSNSVEMLKSVARSSEAICFQIGVGAPSRGAGLKAIALGDAGLRSGKLIVGARRGRVLPVAAAVFTEQLKKQLATVAD